MSFTRKLLIVLILQPVIILGIVFYYLQQALMHESYQALTTEIEETKRGFDLSLEEKRSSLKSALRLAVSDFAFKQAVASRDKETLVTLIKNYRERVNADVFRLVSTKGKYLSQIVEGTQKFPHPGLLKMSANNGAWDYFDIENSKLLLFVISPIRAPDVQAYAVMGIEIDEEFVKAFSSLAQVDLTVVSETKTSPAKILSTFNNVDEIFEITPFKNNQDVKLITYLWDHEQHFGQEIELFKRKGKRGSFIISKRESELLGSYYSLREILVKIVVFSLALAVILAVFWGKTISRRLLKLAALVETIKGDRLVFDLVDKSKDEIGKLTRRFSRMTSELSKYIEANRNQLRIIKKQKQDIEEINKVLTRQVEEDEVAAKIVEKAMNSENVQDFVDFAIANLVVLKGFVNCSLMMETEDSSQFEIISDRVYQSGTNASIKVKSKENYIGKHDLFVAANALSNKKPVVVKVDELAEKIYQDKEVYKDLKNGSFICLPLSTPNRDLGVLNFVSSEPVETWKNSSDLIFLQLIAGKISMALNNMILYRDATTDKLTGIANRSKFLSRFGDELERARRSKKELSLIYLDIDFFKKVNDTYGHAAGDLILSNMAKILDQVVRKTDLPARMGGEEFVVLLPYTDKKGAMVFAEKLRALVEKSRFRYEDKILKITSSFGIATYPEDGVDQEALVKKADEALYQAKKNGRNQSACA